MDEKYIYNGKVYSRADLEKLAAQSEVSFDEYISGIGAKPYTEETPVAETKKTSTSSVSGTYLYNNKEYQAADLQKLAQESGVGFDEYITGIGAKKKSGGTPSNNGTSNTSPSKSVSEQPSPANIAEVAVPSMIGNLIPAFKGKTFGQVAAMPEVQENLRANARPLKINESDVETLKRIRVDAGVTDEKLLSTPIPSVISSFIPSIAGKTFGEVADSDEGRYVQVQIAKKNIQDKINEEIAKFYQIAQTPNQKIIAENKKKLEEISSIENKLALNLTKIADKEESAVVRTDESGNNLKRFMNFLGRYGQITGYVPTPEASDKITNLPSEFFTSLNYMGYKDPVAAARISKSLAEGKPISASQVATMVNMGINIEREKLKDKLESGEIQQKGYVKAEQEFQVKSKENLLGNQEVLRAFLSSGIADIADSIEVSKEVSTPADPLNLFTKIFGHRWNYTDAEIAEYGRKVAAVNGLDPNDARVKDAIKYLQDNEGSLILENSIYKAGWTRDLAKGLAQPIRGIAAGIDDVSKILTDNENDIYVEGQSQGNVLVAEQPTKRVENSWVGTVGKIVEGTGQFITQAGMSYLGGGLFSGIGGLGVRGREIISTLITAGSQSFDSNLKSAMNYTSEDGVAYGVAGGLSFLEGAVENILSPTQVARGIASKFIRGDKATREVINILTDSKIVDKQSVLSKYFNGSIRGILSAGKVAGGEVSEESITEIADFTAQMILNPNSQSFEDRSLWEGLVTTAHETGLSMAIPALLTGVGSANVNNFTKGALISAAQNRLKMIEALDERKAEGGLTDKEYNEKVQLINTAADVNDNLPLKADGTKLNTQEKADYVYSRTAEAVLNKRLQQVNDEAEKSVINDKIKEQQNFRTSILKNEGNQTAQTTEGENAKTATPESNDSEATTRTTPTTNITGELAVGDVIKNKDGELGRITAINDNEITVVNPTNENQVSWWAKGDVDRSSSINPATQTQQPKIESAVIEIGGKIYEGKNHAEAILKAQSDGQDISTVDRNGQGKFKLSDGSIIDRAQAKSQFGQDRSELLIPQDEAADNANKEYAAITSANTKPATSPLTKEAEDLLASLGEGSLPTFITKNLEKIASDNGITITDQMSASDVVNSLREKQTAPQVTTPVTDIPAEAKSKFEAFKNKRQANANQQQSGAVRNETETQIPEGQSDSNLPSSNETQLQNREETETETLTPEDKTFVKEAFDNDLIPSFAKPAISTDGEFDESKAEGFLQELASQSQGIALDGTPLAGGGQDMVARGYPKQLVDLANEKYPLNEGTTTEVNQPIQQNEPTAQEQGTESAVQQSPDATGQVDAGTGNAVLEENKPTISKEQPSETQGNASTPQLGEAVVVNDNDNQNIDNENENTNNTTPIISLSEIKTIEDKGTGAESSNDQAKAAEVIAQVDEILEADKRVSPDEIARQNGEKNVNGTVVKRQNPITAVLGNAVDILFSKSDKQPARYAVVERSDIQPSHKSGIKNETHFIPEAQPRDRGSLEVLKNEAKAKADVLDPNQLAENNIAFFGSPIINSRGEVIQGNGRAEALDYYYDNNKSDSKGYKAMVAAKAKALGLDAAAIANMNEPVLVRLADVNDERAIVLGNYTSSDLEDVKQKDADAKAAIGKLKPAQLVELSNAISSRTSETDTLRTAIRDNAKSIIDILMDVGALRNDNREQYINSTGVTPEGIESAYNVVKQLLFEGGDAELSAKFNNLSFTQREAIEKTIPAILSNKELKQHVQNAIGILHEKTESAESDFDTWAKQSDMFNGGKAPMESYDRNDIALAKSIDNSKTQKEISTTIKQLAQDMTDVPATLFEAEKKGLSFNEAVQKTLPAFQVTTPVSEDVSEMKEIVRILADGTRTLEDIQVIAQAELGNLYDANVVKDAFIELGKETATTPTEVEMVTTGVLGQVGKWMNSLFGASSRPRVFIAKNSERLAAKVKELGGAVRFMINENNNLSLPKIKQYVEDIFTGKAVFERFSPQEQRGFIEGGRIHAEASLILAGNERPNEQAESSNEEQEKSIEKYAKENGIWVENVNEKYGEPHNGGEESIVWGNAEKQTVTKSQNTFLYNNLQEKLDGITLHNTYFPEAPIKVIGFGRNSEGHFQVIVEQPFIKGDSTKITSQEIQDYLTKLGLERNEENNYSTPQILLEDLHTGNAIKTPEGNIIVIDPIMRLNTPEQGYGGTRVVSNSLNVSNDNGSQISFMQSPEGEILGFKHDGKIYLNGERLNANTPIHEAGHLWIEWAKDKSKKLYDKGMELVSAKGNRYLAKVKATPFYQTEAKKLGKEGSKAYENYMKEEALAMAIGDKGAQFVVESRRKTFTDWMKQLFDAVGRVVGISNVKNIEDLTFDQFTKAVAAEILQGGSQNESATTKKAEPKVSGIKKDLTSEAAREEAKIEKFSDKELMEMGRGLLKSGEVNPESLVNSIVANGSGVLTPKEVVALITYKADLDNSLRKAYKSKNAAIESGGDTSALTASILDLESKVQSFEIMAVITANQQSLAFRLRQQLLDRHYNVVTQIERFKANNNGQIPPDIEERFKEVDKELKAIREKLDAAEESKDQRDSEAAINNILEAVNREKEIAARVEAGVQKEIEQIHQNLSPARKRASDKAIDALDKMQKWIRSKNYSDATGMVAMVDAGISTIRTAIKAGVAVADAIEMGISKIKSLLAKNGVTTWDKEGEFRKDMLDGFEVEKVYTPKEAQNAEPYLDESGKVVIPSKYLKDIVADGVTDINDLAAAVHEKVVEISPTSSVREVRDLITNYGKEINPTKDEVQIKLNTAQRIGRLLSELEDLQNGIKKETGNRRFALTVRERELKRKIKALSKSVSVEKSDVDDVSKLQSIKERVRQRITELKDKIENKDFAKKPKAAVTADTELVELNSQKEKLQSEYDKAHYINELKNRSKWQKAGDIAMELLGGLPRALVASIDFSAVLIQGLKRLLTRPLQSWQAFKDSINQMKSDKNQDEWMNKIKAQPWFTQMEQAGVALTQVGGKVSAREELFISDWVNVIYDKLAKLVTFGYAPATEVVKKLNPYKATARAYNGYLNSVRVQGFLEFAKYLENKGMTIESDPKEFQKAADYINTMTGRGSLGKVEQSAGWLSSVFFAPRKVVADLKLFTPYVFIYYAKMPKEVRKKAILDYGQFVSTLVLGNALVWAARAEDDDDEDEFWNTNSTDFLTHKFGDTRIEITGGVRTSIVFMSRLFSGSFTDQYGNTSKLGERFGKQINTRWDLIESFFTNKLAPVPAITKKIMDESDGLEVDRKELAVNAAIPMWMQDVKELYKENPLQMAALFNAMAIFGASVRVAGQQKIIKDTIRHNGEKVQLNEEQYKKFKELSEKKIDQYITDLKNTPQYKNADSQEKAALKKIMTNAAVKSAQNSIKKQYPALFKKETAAEKRKKAREKKRIEQLIKSIADD